MEEAWNQEKVWVSWEQIPLSDDHTDCSCDCGKQASTDDDCESRMDDDEQIELKDERTSKKRWKQPVNEQLEQQPQLVVELLQCFYFSHMQRRMDKVKDP